MLSPDKIIHIFFADCFYWEDFSLRINVSSQGQFHPFYHYDFLDLGELEEYIRKAQTFKKNRHVIVDPDLANVVAQHLVPDLQNSKTVIFECNPGTFYLLCNVHPASDKLTKCVVFYLFIYLLKLHHM